jgi:hypothetical protein
MEGRPVLRFGSVSAAVLWWSVTGVWAAQDVSPSAQPTPEPQASRTAEASVDGFVRRDPRMLWAGDNEASLSAENGLPTMVTAELGAGMSGMPLWTAD